MIRTTIPTELRRLVIERAADRCEYCGLSQMGQEATFHVDHVIPLVAGGQTVSENLALACVTCSLRKAARETATDPKTGHAVPLYNPTAVFTCVKSLGWGFALKSVIICNVSRDPSLQSNANRCRLDTWTDHFCWESVYLVALTPTGRATVEALALNRPLIIAIREEEVLLGRHPPSTEFTM